MIAAGVVGVLLLLGALYVFVLSGDGDDTATDDAAGGSTTEAPSDETADDGTTDGGDDGAGPGDGTTDPTEGGEATDDTTGAAGDGADAVADTEAIEAFRQLLTDNGLTSSRLDDEQVLQFGSSFCALAESSPSPGTFGEFRQQAIEDTANSTLDPDELGLVIDLTIEAFCPDEAERLGIGG